MADPEGTEEIVLDDGAETPAITSDVDPANPETDDETPEGEEPVKKEEAAPAAPAVDWDSEENPYKKRHGDSQREVQENLLPKIKSAEAQIAALLKERDEAMTRLKDEKPEAYDNLTLQRSVEAANRQLAELKERVELDSFIAATPDASPFRAALQQQARAFPSKSLSEIWEGSGFKDVAAARAAAAVAKTEQRKETKPEKGKVTPEPGKATIGGYTEEEFNKLSVAKRGEILAKLEQ